MAILIEIDEAWVPPKKERKNKAKPKPPTIIFDHYKKLTLDGLQKSINDATGRWSEKRPRENYTPSVNWTIRKDNLNTRNVDGEIVDVCYKVGRQTQLAIFPDSKGKPTKKVSIKSGGVLPLLKKLQAQTKSMTKDSEFGKLFHETAIQIASKAASTKTYDRATDTMK